MIFCYSGFEEEDFDDLFEDLEEMKQNDSN